MEVGSTFRRDLKLISETRAPFRGVRKFIYIAFIAAAGISTFFTVPRVIIALQGAEGAPDLLTTVGNLAINLGGEGDQVLGPELYGFGMSFRTANSGAPARVAPLVGPAEEEQTARMSRMETVAPAPL